MRDLPEELSPRRSAFISFSERSRPETVVFGYLAGRLRAIGLSVWCYFQRGQRVRPGQDIADACTNKVLSSDVFVALLGEASLGSEFCAIEVAASRRGRMEGRPVVVIGVDLTGPSRESWPEDRRWLSESLLLRLDPLSLADVDARADPGEVPPELVDVGDRLVNECSRVLKLPPIDDEPIPLLPLRTRIHLELGRALPRSEPFEGPWSMADAMALKVLRDVRAGDRRSAADSAQRLLVLEDLYPILAGRLYYPRIAVGVTQLDLADAATDEATWQGSLAQAERSFLSALQLSTSHPTELDRATLLAGPFDENALAGLALVYLKRDAPGDAERALDHVRAARRLGDADDPALLFLLLLAHLRLGQTRLQELRSTRLPIGFWESDGYDFVRDENDFRRFAAVRAAALAMMGRTQAFRKQFLAEVREWPADAFLQNHDALMLCVDALLANDWTTGRHGRDAALDLLEIHLPVLWREKPLPDRVAGSPLEEARHRRARCLLESSRLGQAQREYDRLVAEFSSQPQYLVEYGVCHEQLGHVEMAKRCYEAVVSSAWYPAGSFHRERRAVAAEYYRGYAHWRLGERTRAHGKLSSLGPVRRDEFPAYHELDRRLNLRRG